MQMILSDEERVLLTEILQERHSALLREIARADSYEFRQTLQHREQVLEQILTKMGVMLYA